MDHICNLLIWSSKFIADLISKMLNWFRNIIQLSLLFILRYHFEIELSLQLSAYFLKVPFFVFFWTYQLVKLLSQIFVDCLIEFV